MRCVTFNTPCVVDHFIRSVLLFSHHKYMIEPWCERHLCCLQLFLSQRFPICRNNFCEHSTIQCSSHGHGTVVLQAEQLNIKWILCRWHNTMHMHEHEASAVCINVYVMIQCCGRWWNGYRSDVHAQARHVHCTIEHPAGHKFSLLVFDRFSRFLHRQPSNNELLRMDKADVAQFE